MGAAAGTWVWQAGRAHAHAANEADGFADYQHHAEGAERRQQVGVGLMIAGGGLLTAGIVRWVLVAPSGGEALAIVPSRTGAAIVLARPF